jgi:hypothetical protein
MTTIDTRPDAATKKQSGRHPINVGHLVMGIAFLGIVVVWFLVEADAVTGDDIRWLLPLPWVLAGVAGLIATTRRHRDTEEWRDAAYGAHERGWIGQEAAPAPTHDDLDEKLARAEREVQVRQATGTADPADPADPADTKEHDR